MKAVVNHTFAAAWMVGWWAISGVWAVGGEAGESGPSAQPTCALVDTSRSPLTALVEAKLLEGPGQWLERREIDKALAEQNLQAVLGAQAGRERIRLGKLLKADVLAILRTGEEDQRPVVELVLAETAGGLRLTAQTIFLSGQASRDAAAVAELACMGMKRYGRKIAEVYAVPLLTSHDLTYEHEHLRATYAKLLQQQLLEQPGAVIVELAEAQSLVNEYRLAAPDEKPRRRLPLYVLGEYRHEGLGDQLRVTIGLRATRGEQQVLQAKQALRPADAPRFLQQTAARLIAGADAQLPRHDPAAEARQLAERGQAALRMGNWYEALGLLESSLLLDEEPLEPRHDVLRVYECLQPRNPLNLADREAWQQLVGRRHRAVHVLESLFSAERDVRKFCLSAARLAQYRYRGEQLLLLPEDLRKSFRQLREREHALEMRLVHRLAEQRDWLASGYWLRAALEDRMPAERYAERAKLFLQYQGDQPGVPYLIVRAFATGDRPLSELCTLEGRQFLRDLLASRELESLARKGVEDLQAQCEAEWPKRILVPADVRPIAPAAPPAPTSAAASVSPLFRPLEIRCEFAKGRVAKAALTNGNERWLALANGIDVFAERMIRGDYRLSLFALKSKDRATRLWTDSGEGHITSLEDDGRYLWMTLCTSHSRQTPQVWVFDPAAERSWQITAEHGLPLVSEKDARGGQTVMASPVEPGRAILAGAFGRSWIADVRFDPAGKHQVHVFHQAKEMLDEPRYQSVHGPNVVFEPRRMATFFRPGPGGTVERQVAIARESPLRGTMIMDPEKAPVPSIQNWYFPSSDDCMYQGSLYYVSGASAGKRALVRCDLPDFKPTVVIDDVPSGQVVIHRDTVHIVGKQWWRGSLTERRLTCAGDTPWTHSERSSPRPYVYLRHVAASNHYGIVVAYSIRQPVRLPKASPSPQLEFAQVDFSVPSAPVVRSESSAGPPAGVPPRPAVGTLTSVEELRAGPPADGKLRFWHDLATCTSLAFSPDGKLVISTASITKVAAVQAWSADDGRLMSNLLGPSPGMGDVKFSTDGQFFATAGVNGPIVLWSARGLKPLRTFGGPSDDIALSSDGRWLAGCDRGKTLRVWDAQTGEEKFHAYAHAEQLLFLPDGKRLLVHGLEGPQVWHIEGQSGPLRLESLRHFCGLLRDGTVLGTADDATLSLVAWNPQTFASRRLWAETPGKPILVSPDGRHVVLWCDAGVFGRHPPIPPAPPPAPPLRLYELATGRQVRFGDGDYPAMSAVFSADGTKFATKSFRDGGLRWWDIPSQPALNGSKISEAGR